MLTIRMQRTGRKGHAMFRVVVQDSRQTPTSGKVVAALGSYDPHAKTVILDKEKAAFYLEHGAQPSDRAVRLLKNEGVKLPDWVKQSAKKERTVKNAEKRRSTAPAKPAEEKSSEEAAVPEASEETAPEAPESEAPAETAAEETAVKATETEKPTDTDTDSADNTEAEASKAEESTEEKPAES